MKLPVWQAIPDADDARQATRRGTSWPTHKSRARNRKRRHNRKERTER